MTDRYQLTAVIAAAVRDCHHEMIDAQLNDERSKPLGNEEANYLAKAVFVALKEAGFQITPRSSG